MSYLILKYAHLLSMVLLFGTGLDTVSTLSGLVSSTVIMEALTTRKLLQRK